MRNGVAHRAHPVASRPTAAKADHSILSTWKLPAGAKEVMEPNSVLITKPAHVVFLVGVLRRHSIQIAALRVAGKDASGRKPSCSPWSAAKGEDLDAKEKTAHEKIWKERSKLNASLKAVSDSIIADIDDIIGEDDLE